MTPKMFEVRDRGTFIPVLAVRLDPAREADRYLIARAGYGRDAEAQSTYIVIVKLVDMRSSTSPFDWGNRTMETAHKYINELFDTMESGQVVDVEFILGQKPEPRPSESSPGPVGSPYPTRG